ncbi:MAG TPA: GtrA family protein [candidate division Zixibacteria bacterium]|nr:GtrA family protein [candidate division Zixibacteria bacterium]
MISLIASAAGRFGINPKEAERFTKFLVVGTLGFIIDFGTLTFLVEVVDLPGLVADNTQFSELVGLVLANTISFTLAVISNFTLNRFWTYPESRSVRKRVQLPQFTVVSIAGLVINNIIFALSVPLFDRLISAFDIVPTAIEAYIPAKILATIVVLFWNFFVNRYWTYRHIDQ